MSCDWRHTRLWCAELCSLKNIENVQRMRRMKEVQYKEFWIRPVHCNNLRLLQQLGFSRKQWFTVPSWWLANIWTNGMFFFFFLCTFDLPAGRYDRSLLIETKHPRAATDLLARLLYTTHATSRKRASRRSEEAHHNHPPPFHPPPELYPIRVVRGRKPLSVREFEDVNWLFLRQVQVILPEEHREHRKQQ